ncbi:unnamed protein product, partial [marine sediment metagenome]
PVLWTLAALAFIVPVALVAYWHLRLGRFIVRFLVVVAVLFALDALVSYVAPGAHRWLQDFNVSMVSELFWWHEVHHTVHGANLIHNGVSAQITVACAGSPLYLLYGALLVADNALTKKQRLAGLLFGIPLLLIYNMLRILWSVYVHWQTHLNIHDAFYLLSPLVVLFVWWFVRSVALLRPESPASAASHGLTSP